VQNAGNMAYLGSLLGQNQNQGMNTYGGYGSATEGSSNFIGPLSSMGGYAGGASSAGGVYDLAYMEV
jgi:hypothetical protein